MLFFVCFFLYQSLVNKVAHCVVYGVSCYRNCDDVLIILSMFFIKSTSNYSRPVLC